jgi:hypothetical protein
MNHSFPHSPPSTSDTLVFRCRVAANHVKRMSHGESRPLDLVGAAGLELAVGHSGQSPS